MKKLICLLICLSMLIFTLSACKTADNESGVPSKDASSEAVSEVSEVSEEYVLFSNLPDKKYNDETFTVLVEGDYLERYKSVEICPHENSPAVISEAVTNRNSLVEEKFGIKIVELRTENGEQMISNIRSNSAGGTALYDAVMPFMPEAATLSVDKMFLDLTKCENIHLDMAYWDNSAIKDLSIGNSLYFVAGDMNLLAYDCTSCIVFNKDMIQEHQLENPYDLVDNGTWTLDKLYSMAKDVTAKVTTDASMGLDDIWGFLTNAGIATNLYISSGQRLSSKDANDLPVLALKGTSQSTVFNKIYELVNDPKVGIIEDYTAEYTDVYTKASESVANKRAMFRTMVVVDIVEMGDYDCNFGIIPTPKFDETQSEYYSYVSTIYATASAIPIACRDSEMSAIIVDAMCQASTATVKTAYYDNMLKLRKLQDEEGERMLDLVFKNRVYDFGAIFGWGGTSKCDANSISNFMSTVCSSGSNSFTSKLDSLYGTFQADVDKTIEALG